MKDTDSYDAWQSEVDMDKNKERMIFDCVYSDRVLASVIPAEEPDFIAENVDGKFGVEVTEFYFSQSKARLRNIPGYTAEILDNNKYRHKHDIKLLKPKEVMITPGDNRGPSYKTNAIIEERPSIYEYVNKILDLIENKNKRFESYKVGLKHVNLIIFDCEDGLLGIPGNAFHHFLFQPQLEKILMNTDFREIFLITRLGEFSSSKRVCIPLKMLFLVAEVFLCNYIMAEESPNELITKKRSSSCAEYLKWRGMKNIYFKDIPDGYEIAYENSGIVISEDNHVTIHDYDDKYLLSDFILPTSEEVSNLFDSTFLKLFEKYKSSCIFRSELYFHVNESNQLETE